MKKACSITLGKCVCFYIYNICVKGKSTEKTNKLAKKND